MFTKICIQRRDCLLLFSIIAFWLGSGSNAFAHGDETLTDETIWRSWPFTAEIVLLTALAIVVYVRGMTRIRSGSARKRRYQAVFFFTGLAAIFLALQSPIDPIAERLFSIHQLQHFLLRMLGPMLLALAAPQGVLIAGLPRNWRRPIFKYIGSKRWLRRVLAVLMNPAFVWVSFIASLYIWQIPAFHNTALNNSVIHYIMHISMLVSGLLFWGLIFDHRDAANTVSHALRLLMLLGAIVSNILLGALITLKEVVIYTAYDDAGPRLFDVMPLVDEGMGGYIIWVPSSMMCLVAILIVIHGWGKHEARHYARRHNWLSANSVALEFPETAEELWIKVDKVNVSTAYVLAAIPVSMFVVALGTALIVSYVS
ncbi:MAG: cytochrome c oxidase assembly protein [Amylibacter sp.]|nr:cytochrome c oxidase assembly protein [Amylibacter sp.]